MQPRDPRRGRAHAHVAFDSTVPVVVIKVGRYPMHHGGIGAIRSLGRVGVPTYAMVESRFAPAATSRYLTGRLRGTLNASDSVEELLAGLVGVGRRIGRAAIALPTDDEAAVLIARHAEELSPWFITPNVEPGLPARLASKIGLRDLCLQHGVATPAAAFPVSLGQVEEFGDQAIFPVIAKCADPWLRLDEPTLRDPKIVRSRGELLALATEWGETPNVTLQEYLPRAESVDWIFGGYFNGPSDPEVFGTAVKYRSWPPDGGPTAFARVNENTRLAAEATRFCRAVGYRGIVDMDWRYDRRDDEYKLIDCNPRIGAQFRLLENDAGIDFARALHLGLTGREIPRGRQQVGRGFSAEPYDARAVVAYRRMEPDASPAVRPRGHVELGWLAWDDPLPFAAMGAYSIGRAADRVKQRARRLCAGRSRY